MKNIVFTASFMALVAAQASAVEVERWSVKVGNTYVATVKIDGVPVQPNTNGISSRIALSERATTKWAESRYENVTVVPYEQFILDEQD